MKGAGNLGMGSRAGDSPGSEHPMVARVRVGQGSALGGSEVVVDVAVRLS